jgi:hypothetical protein
MLTEAFQSKFVGGHEWRIPIFLFREHADVEAYLWDLAREPARTRQIFGRFGSDFVGLSLNDAGEVVRFIAGEAKWRQRLNKSVVDSLMLGPWVEDDGTGERARSGRGVWFDINRDTLIPHGLRQLQRLLELRDPEGHQAAILSIDQAIILDNAPPLPRTNLILIAGNGGVAPCFVELCEAVVAVNDVKRPSQFGQERDCLFPFRSERRARAAMPEVACRL